MNKKDKDPYSQCRRTPKNLIEFIESEWLRKIDLDIAADDELDGHVCKRYFTVENSAFENHWKCKLGFCNPPFEKMLPWIHRSQNEIYNGNAKKIIMVASLSIQSSDFYLHAYRNYNMRTIVLSGRVEYEPHPLSEAFIEKENGKKTSVNGGTILLEFGRNIQPGQTTLMEWRYLLRRMRGKT